MNDKKIVYTGRPRDTSNPFQHWSSNEATPCPTPALLGTPRARKKAVGDEMRRTNAIACLSKMADLRHTRKDAILLLLRTWRRPWRIHGRFSFKTLPETTQTARESEGHRATNSGYAAAPPPAMLPRAGGTAAGAVRGDGAFSAIEAEEHFIARVQFC